LLGRTHSLTSGLQEPLRVPYDASDAAYKMAVGLDSVLREHAGKDVVIVCVGTDRSTGDAFGPIIGSRLSRVVTGEHVYIYGTLDTPVHAVNLGAKLEDISYFHRSRPHIVIAIDACLGKFDHVGQIVLERGALRPGAGVKKELPEFGAYTITGVVNVAGFMEYFVLQNTRLGIVMKMSDVVVHALSSSLRRFQDSHESVEVPGAQ